MTTPQEAARTALARQIEGEFREPGPGADGAPSAYQRAYDVAERVLTRLQADPDAARAVVALLGEEDEMTALAKEYRRGFVDGERSAAPQDDREAPHPWTPERCLDCDESIEDHRNDRTHKRCAVCGLSDLWIDEHNDPPAAPVGRPCSCGIKVVGAPDPNCSVHRLPAPQDDRAALRAVRDAAGRVASLSQGELVNTLIAIETIARAALTRSPQAPESPEPPGGSGPPAKGPYDPNAIRERTAAEYARLAVKGGSDGAA